MKTTHLLIIIVLLTFCSSVWSAKVCDSLRHIDRTWAMDIQYFGNRAQKAVSTEVVYREDCDQNEKAVAAISDYITNCLEILPKEVGMLIINGLRVHQERRCQNVEYAKPFMEHNRCFEDAEVFEKFHQCGDRLHHHFQALKNLNLSVVQGIQASCCILHDIQRCVRVYNVQLCHDANANFWDTFIDEVVDDHRAKFCAQLKTAEMCDANFPRNIWEKIDGHVRQMDLVALKARPGKFVSNFVTILDMAAGNKL